MTNNGIVNIHGKDYMTVAGRVNLFHDENKENISITTELIPNDKAIVFKAIVVTKKGTFTGYSAVSLDSTKMIEKSNPYEVAETSAVGRALGFAGYGIVEGIASADEMVKAGADKEPVTDGASWLGDENTTILKCKTCGKPTVERKGVSKAGKAYHGLFCTSEDKTHTEWISDFTKTVKKEALKVDEADYSA